MRARYRSWWRRVKRSRFVILIILSISIVTILLIVLGYGFEWSGFNGSNNISTTRILSGVSAGTVTRTEVYQPGKTLWDWLQLLIIPAVLAIGGFILNLTISRREQEATVQRDQTEREIARDNQYEVMLQTYIDKISELILEKNLLNSNANDEVRKIARVRTLTVLLRLDKERKKSLIQFLHESHLINKDDSIIELRGADLIGTNLGVADFGRDFLNNLVAWSLRGGNLEKANLSGTNLSGANLSEINLSGADLSYANLSGANLIGVFTTDAISLAYANLTGCDLRGAFLDKALLSRADLSGANLSRTSSERANLSASILSEANLSGAFLGGADLSGANLSEANLSEADLSGVNFAGNGLDRAANLSGANLSRADLSGANLQNVTSIAAEQLDKAKSLKGTIMPDGSIHS